MMQDTKALAQQQFAQNPEDYVTSATFALGEDLARLRALIQPESDWRMLDIATGGGHTARLFAPDLQTVIASDLTYPMLDTARSAHLDTQNMHYHQLDGEALPYQSASFDLVTCRIAAHHFPDLKGFVAEAARITRPGGIVAIIDIMMPKNRKAARYVNAFERLRDPSHAWAYSLPRWTGFFKNAAIAVQHTETQDLRLNFSDYVGRMNCSPEVVTRLRAMLIQAPEKAASAFNATHTTVGEIAFSLQLGTVIGRKKG